MKQGRTLQALGKELERQRNARQDFIADTRSIEMESVAGVRETYFKKTTDYAVDPQSVLYALQG